MRYCEWSEEEEMEVVEQISSIVFDYEYDESDPRPNEDDCNDIARRIVAYLDECR